MSMQEFSAACRSGKPERSSSITTLSLLALASFASWPAPAEAGERPDVLSRTAGPGRVLGGSPLFRPHLHRVNFSAERRLDVAWEDMRAHLLFLGGDSPKSRAAADEFMTKIFQTPMTRVLSIDHPDSKNPDIKIVCDNTKHQVIEAAAPTVNIEMQVSLPRGSVSARTPVVQRIVIDVEKPLTANSITLRSVTPGEMRIHKRFSMGPSATELRIVRDGDGCKLFFTGTMAITTYRPLGRTRILREGSDQFDTLCVLSFDRAAKLLEAGSGDKQRRAGIYELFKLYQKLNK